MEAVYIFAADVVDRLVAADVVDRFVDGSALASVACNSSVDYMRGCVVGDEVQ